MTGVILGCFQSLFLCNLTIFMWSLLLPAVGRACHHGVLRKPVLQGLREGGWYLSFHKPPDKPALHQRPAVLGASSHHLHCQPAQGHPAQVRRPPVRPLSFTAAVAKLSRLFACKPDPAKHSDNAWVLNSSFVVQIPAQTAKAVGEWGCQHENCCGGDHRPALWAGQRHGHCKLTSILLTLPLLVILAVQSNAKGTVILFCLICST